MSKVKPSQDPDNHIKNYRAIFAEGKCVAWPKSNSANERNGFNVTTNEEWIRLSLCS